VPHSWRRQCRSRRHECESEYPYIQVPRNASVHVFQWRPFTLIRVLYVLYGLPANFTLTSSFCAGRVFIQPVWSEQHKICINLIDTDHDAYLTWLNCSLLGAPHFCKIINDVVEYCYFFSQSIRSIRFHWILSINRRWVMCLYKWPRTLQNSRPNGLKNPRMRRKLTKLSQFYVYDGSDDGKSTDWHCSAGRDYISGESASKYIVQGLLCSMHSGNNMVWSSSGRVTTVYTVGYIQSCDRLVDDAAAFSGLWLNIPTQYPVPFTSALSLSHLSAYVVISLMALAHVR